MKAKVISSIVIPLVCMIGLLPVYGQKGAATKYEFRGYTADGTMWGSNENMSVQIDIIHVESGEYKFADGSRKSGTNVGLNITITFPNGDVTSGSAMIDSPEFLLVMDRTLATASFNSKLTFSYQTVDQNGQWVTNGEMPIDIAVTWTAGGPPSRSISNSTYFYPDSIYRLRSRGECAGATCGGTITFNDGTTVDLVDVSWWPYGICWTDNGISGVMHRTKP